jgi:hypothetical protein
MSRRSQVGVDVKGERKMRDVRECDETCDAMRTRRRVGAECGWNGIVWYDLYSMRRVLGCAESLTLCGARWMVR